MTIKINLNSPAGNVMVPLSVANLCGYQYRWREMKYDDILAMIERDGFISFYKTDEYVMYPFANNDIIACLVDGVPSEELDARYNGRDMIGDEKKYQAYLKKEKRYWTKKYGVVFDVETALPPSEVMTMYACPTKCHMGVNPKATSGAKSVVSFKGCLFPSQDRETIEMMRSSNCFLPLEDIKPELATRDDVIWFMERVYGRTKETHHPQDEGVAE